LKKRGQKREKGDREKGDRLKKRGTG